MSRPRNSLWLVALLGLAASSVDGPPPLPPLPHKSAQVERGAGAQALLAKPQVVVPPKTYYLAWDFPATNSAFTNWSTLVLCSTNLKTWQVWTNLPFAATNTTAIPAGRFWRVAYTKSP